MKYRPQTNNKTINKKLNLSYRIAFILYLLFMLYRAVRHGYFSDITRIPLWQLQQTHRLLAWIGGLTFIGFCEFMYYVPIGFLSAMVVPQGFVRLGRSPVNLPALLAASLITVLLCVVEIGKSWYLAAAVGFLLPLLGCLFGIWMGTTWLRGRHARLLFLPKVALLIFMASLLFGIIFWLSVEGNPLPFEADMVTSAEKRRLVYMIREKSPRSLIEGQTQTLRLTEHDVNVLLFWGLSLGSPNRKAKISIMPNSASLSASVGINLNEEKVRYLNLIIAGTAECQSEIPNLKFSRCRLGSIELPQWFLRAFSPFFTSLLRHDRRSKPFLDAVTAISIEPNVIEVTYGPVHLPTYGFRRDIFGPASSSEEVLASTRAQINNLLAVVEQLPDIQPSFEMCFETAFSLARDRSIDGDLITENRAAVFALGMLLGHHRVEEFLGPVYAESGHYAARRALYKVTLHGRSDWTKHFCVAAAIALFSDEIISDAAGLLKEELDADIGGSGFSFSDLLASRAGTTFAVQATRDEASARAMQLWIIKGFREDDFCPRAADLPEDIMDAELQSRYGGVGGEGYNKLVAEIERRIAACPAYR